MNAIAKVYPQVASDPYVSDEAAGRLGLGTAKGLVVGGIIRNLCGHGGNGRAAFESAKSAYGGERHPVATALHKGLIAGIGSSGGFIVPPEIATDFLELLRPQIAVRAAGPRIMPMPRGTLTSEIIS